MKSKKINKQIKIWNWQALVLAFEIAFALCFFLGIFFNAPFKSPARIQVLNERYAYYINRGYPISWAGVSRLSLPVDFPIVKAPFLTMQTYDGSQYVKIIDLSIFVPLFLAVLFIAYLALVFIFSKISKNQPLQKYVFTIMCSILTLCCFFFYLFWFPRI